jgi:hypothetical protein
MHANAPLLLRNRAPKSSEGEVGDLAKNETTYMHTARGRLEHRLRQAFAERARQGEASPQCGEHGQAISVDWRNQ